MQELRFEAAKQDKVVVSPIGFYPDARALGWSHVWYFSAFSTHTTNFAGFDLCRNLPQLVHLQWRWMGLLFSWWIEARMSRA